MGNRPRPGPAPAGRTPRCATRHFRPPPPRRGLLPQPHRAHLPLRGRLREDRPVGVDPLPRRQGRGDRGLAGVGDRDDPVRVVLDRERDRCAPNGHVQERLVEDDGRRVEQGLLLPEAVFEAPLLRVRERDGLQEVGERARRQLQHGRQLAEVVRRRRHRAGGGGLPGGLHVIHLPHAALVVVRHAGPHLRVHFLSHLAAPSGVPVSLSTPRAAFRLPPETIKP